MENKESKQKTDEQMIQEEFDRLLQEYINSNHRRKVEKITKAFNFAKQAHEGARRRSGEPYILHPLAVARIVCGEMGLGSTSICSALLHDVVEDTEYTVKDIEDMFGEKIAQIVRGLTKISGEIFGDQSSAQAENFRKLLLTMSDDIRVILIKIADRLHNMRTLDSMLPAKQFKIAGETFFIYAPLAHRLGLFSIKSELEDLSFKYDHPNIYAEIKAKIQSTQEERATLFEHFAAPLIKKLNEKNITYEIKDRVKSVYSIHKKMQAKNVSFSEIYDIYAVRIVFDPKENIDEKNMCWDIYTTITDLYRQRPDRLRDWVSTPKANGYQALHLTVMGPDGEWVEVQIRSRRMDDIAEKGFAAHWKYKEHNVEEDTELDKWLHTITEILENPNPNALDFLDTIKLNLFSSEIFVFTPRGEIKTLPQGATALDFAYAIHTNLGNHCIGAKVNHKLVPLSHRLSSGDQVEVLTSKSQHPRREWLNFVTTAKARTKVDVALRRMRSQEIRKGEEMVVKALKQSALQPSYFNLDRLTHSYGFNKRDEFFLAVAKEEIELPQNVKKIFKPKSEGGILKYVKQAFGVKTDREVPEEPIPQEKPKELVPVFDKKKTYSLVETSEGKNYVEADCCKPIPGDDALGFINDDGRVVVHKRSCPIAMRLKSSFGERILSTEWNIHSDFSYEAMLEVKGIDSAGMMAAVINVISGQFKLDIQKLVFEAKDGVFEGRVKVLVADVEMIKKLCQALEKQKGIQSATRVSQIDS